jgi:catechol 2,3-dioxygenase-like lactoylglutathione lyase family enzyme
MRLRGVLETALYHDSSEREQMEWLYRDVLQLPLVAGWSDAMAFRLGDGVVLLFDRELIAGRDEPQAAHAASGPGHLCFRANATDYDSWRERIAAAGVRINHEHDWERGRRSFYFNDPAGNLLEIADGDLWPEAPPEFP